MSFFAQNSTISPFPKNAWRSHWQENMRKCVQSGHAWWIKLHFIHHVAKAGTEDVHNEPVEQLAWCCSCPEWPVAVLYWSLTVLLTWPILVACSLPCSESNWGMRSIFVSYSMQLRCIPKFTKYCLCCFLLMFVNSIVTFHVSMRLTWSSLNITLPSASVGHDSPVFYDKKLLKTVTCRGLFPPPCMAHYHSPTPPRMYPMQNWRYCDVRLKFRLTENMHVPYVNDIWLSCLQV